MTHYWLLSGTWEMREMRENAILCQDTSMNCAQTSEGIKIAKVKNQKLLVILRGRNLRFAEYISLDDKKGGTN